MNIDPKLREIADKVEAGVRLGRDDGLLLSRTPTCSPSARLPTWPASGCMATSPTITATCTSIRPTSAKRIVPFCSFARLKEDMPGAYTMSAEHALEWIEKRYRPGMTEVHVVNGLNPHLPFSYYTDLLRAIRAGSRPCT